jgi:hypothetical protein
VHNVSFSEFLSSFNYFSLIFHYKLCCYIGKNLVSIISRPISFVHFEFLNMYLHSVLNDNKKQERNSQKLTLCIARSPHQTRTMMLWCPKAKFLLRTCSGQTNHENYGAA